MSEQVQKLTYTEAEACEALGVSRRTLYSLRTNGRIGFTHIGCQIRYTKKHLDDYVASNEISPKRFKKAS